MKSIDINNPILASADEAASVVLNQAMFAAAQGTFAVGGAIIDNATGCVIKTMHNNVLKPLQNPIINLTEKIEKFTYDPTAHGERQLVYWYYANKDELKLPEPSELTIITTLDPCAMCTGALLTAGFNVGVVAIDDFAGINYDTKFKFEDLPTKLRPLAKSNFGYYACGGMNDPSIYVRTYNNVGGDKVAFKETVINAQKLMGCGSIFQASVQSVRDSSSSSGLTPDKLLNPASLPGDSPIKKKYQEIYPDAFKIAVPPRLPNAQLRDLLQKTKNAKSGAKNAVALLDPFGNVVLCLADSFDISPVHNAFMNVTRAYAIARFELMDDTETQQDASNYLTHPKYGTFVFLYAPNPSDATTIMTLGAYGSTMEGLVPQFFPANFQYYYPPEDGGTTNELRSVIMNLPPFYNNRNTDGLQISAMEVGTTDLEPVPIYLYKAENPSRYYYSPNPHDNPGEEWSKGEVVFYAFQASIVGATPVYQFSAKSPHRYGFGTNPSPALGWTNDNRETFYVLTSASTDAVSVPVYQYHQILSGGYWNMFYSVDQNVQGWIEDGIAFYVLPSKT